jgi:LmbE family N-acetylglucosaminyl deacetylase
VTLSRAFPPQRAVSGLAAAVVFLASALASPAGAQDRGAILIGELARNLGVTARVLMIGAHPDDEDTPIISWLARGHGVETAYLSLTRGDGGQNLIGNELGEALGVIRTEELLAARRVDGGRQYFTRAYDFGFSKSAQETFRHWPRDSVLGDVVRVVRAFRPHVIISVFSGTPRDGHGHHQVAGLLAREAYDIAGDSIRYPANTYGAPWTPAKFYRSARFNPQQATLTFNVGEYSALRGRSYAELAGESRSQHKSQAFGALEPKGPVTGRLALEHSRVRQGAQQDSSILAGIDTSWTRFREVLNARQRVAIDSLPVVLGRLNARLDLRRPWPIVAELGRIQGIVGDLCGEAGCVANQRGQLDEDLQVSVDVVRDRLRVLALHAGGVAVEATATREVWPLGDTIPVAVTVYNRGPLRVSLGGTSIRPDSFARRTDVVMARIRTEPWWLVEGRAGDLFMRQIPAVADDRREAPVSVPLSIAVGDVRFTDDFPVVYRYADPVRGEVQKPVVIAPGLSLTLPAEVSFVPANRPIERRLRVSVRSAFDTAKAVSVSLSAPSALQVDSARRSVVVPARGVVDVEFDVRGRLQPGDHRLSVSATSQGGAEFRSGYSLVEYDHIRPQRMYRKSELTLRAVDAAVAPGTTVAYVPGVGDNVAGPLRELGVPVTVVDPRNLARENLSSYSALVIGPRAFEASDQLVAASERILSYARNGGTVVVQYGQYEMMQRGMLPYAITLTRPAERVTVEEAPVRVLEPASPLLRYPNQIGESDFAGWVQERGLYMPSAFAPQWTPIFALNDEGEKENRGALLVAPYGRGIYVYVTLSLFRQLPAGVPGAARLMLNLISARQAGGGIQ